MPIYEYACRSCGCKVEILQGINDVPLVQCNQCHQPTLQKLVSSSLFRLKGGGWYETDFKKESDKKKNLADSAESSPSAEPTKDKAESSGEVSTSGVAEKTSE